MFELEDKDYEPFIYSSMYFEPTITNLWSGRDSKVLGGVVEPNEAEEYATAKEDFKFGEPLN